MKKYEKILIQFKNNFIKLKSITNIYINIYV